MKHVEIFDIDGVLVDSSHRYRTLPNGKIDLPYWRAMNTPENIAKDRLLPTVNRYKASLFCPDTYTVLATARACGPADFAFIRDRLGWPDRIIYRKENDDRHDADLKIAGVKRFIGLRWAQRAAKAIWEDNRVTLEAFGIHFPDFRRILVKSEQGA